MTGNGDGTGVRPSGVPSRFGSVAAVVVLAAAVGATLGLVAVGLAALAEWAL